MTITNIILTAYCSCKLCCGPSAKGICTNNHPPQQGITIAASRSIPLGTHVHIEGYTNDFIVNDRLTKRFDKRVDIYFNKHKDAINFGIKTNNTITIKDK